MLKKDYTELIRINFFFDLNQLLKIVDNKKCWARKFTGLKLRNKDKSRYWSFLKMWISDCGMREEGTINCL